MLTKALVMLICLTWIKLERVEAAQLGQLSVNGGAAGLQLPSVVSVSEQAKKERVEEKVWWWIFLSLEIKVNNPMASPTACSTKQAWYLSSKLAISQKTN